MFNYLRYGLLAVIVLSCQQTATKKKETHVLSQANDFHFSYDLEKPDQVLELSKQLRQISGISFYNGSTLCAICDDKEYLYFLNAYSGDVISKISIAKDGDFEDVCVTPKGIFVLQSNGVLWKVTEPTSDSPRIQKIELPINPPFELEGLCTSIGGDSLLIAAKYWHGGKDKADSLPVWSFAISENQFAQTPYFKIYSVSEQSSEHLFHTSAISVIPRYNHFIALSTSKKFLRIYTTEEKLKKEISLSKNEFTQPEGICFNQNGDMFISNEGKEDKATILIFKKLLQ